MKSATITITFKVNDDETLESVKIDKDVPDDMDPDNKQGVHALFSWITSNIGDACS